MAIVKVQSTTAAQAGGVSASFTITCAATASGSLLVLMFAQGWTDTVSTISDDKGNTWTEAAGAAAVSSVTGEALRVLYAYNATAGVTAITVTGVNTGVKQARFYEFSGAKTTADPFDGASHINAGVGATPTETNPLMAQTGSNALFLAQVAVSTNNFTGVGAPFTYDPAIIQLYQGICYLISSDSSNHTPAWANPASQTVTLSGISFKEATAAATNTTTMALVF